MTTIQCWSQDIFPRQRHLPNDSLAAAEMGDRGYNTHGPKRGGCCAPFTESWDPVKYNVAWAEVYFHTKWLLHLSSRLATIDIGQKLDGVAGVPFF